MPIRIFIADDHTLVRAGCAASSTTRSTRRVLFEALRVGAAGYVLKSSAESDLVGACRTAMRGEPLLYPKAVGALVRDYLGRVHRGELVQP